MDYRPLVVDLSSQASVRAAAAAVLSWADVPHIDILVNSAGVMGLPERTLSVDGVEMHLATNHVGHFLLTCTLMPKLLAAAAAASSSSASTNHRATRVVNVSADVRRHAGSVRWSDPSFSRPNRDLPPSEQPDYDLLAAWGYEDPRNVCYTGIQGYVQTKIANVLFGIALTRRLAGSGAGGGILSVGVHPGVIGTTDLSRNFPAANLAAIDKMLRNGTYQVKSQGAGAATSLVAALDPALDLVEDGAVGGEGARQRPTRDGRENYGAYLVDCQINGDAGPLAVSSAEAEKLWALSEELVGEKFAW